MAEKEYIEREAALDFNFSITVPQDRRIQVCDAVQNTVKAIAAHIESIPAADVVDVRHGEWVVSRTDFGWNCSEFPTHCKCTLCGREVPYQDRDNYCPNCGAKMDGGVNDAAD